MAREFKSGNDVSKIEVSEDKTKYIGVFDNGNKKVELKNKKDADDFANMLKFFGFKEE